MKPRILAVAVVASLLADTAMADVAGPEEVNEVMLTAELTFSAASLYIGATNGKQGYIGLRSFQPASLVSASE